MDTVAKRSPVKERQALLDFLIPELKKLVSVWGVREETLKLLSYLPKGDFSYLNTPELCPLMDGYLPDLLAGQSIGTLNSQQKLFYSLNFVANLPEQKKIGKKILVYHSPEKNRALWFDCRTKNMSIYTSSIDVRIDKNVFFIKGFFFPSKI